MPKGRPRGESDLSRPTAPRRRESNGYGFPMHNSFEESPKLAAVSETPTTLPTHNVRQIPYELLTAILLPLPYLLSSLLNSPETHTSHAKHSTNLEAAEGILEEVASSALPVPTSSPSLIHACALTAGTLLLVGLWGRIRSHSITLDRRKGQSAGRRPTTNTKPLLSWETLKRVLLRLVTVGLPFLATVEIGGVRTGMIILAAAAGGLLSPDVKMGDQVHLKTWRRTATTRTLTCVVFFVTATCDVFWLRTDAEPTLLIRGYVALIKSILFLQIPLPIMSTAVSRLNATRTVSASNTPPIPSTIWGAPPVVPRASRQEISSPLISTIQDTNLTLIAGAFLGMLTFVLCWVLGVSSAIGYTTFAIFAASVLSAATMLTFARPWALRSRPFLGYGVGVVFCSAYGSWFGPSKSTFALLAVSCLSYAALRFDTRSTAEQANLHDHDHDHATDHHHSSRSMDGSAFTKLLLRYTDDWPLLHGILLEKESRRIVYFMSINLAFMFIQTFYAVASGSLGLLSDSIHMFFDCVGLLAGLVAAVMSKWPPNSKFPYGYGKVETLSGLGNGIFLMIISVEIIFESVERFLDGAEIRRLNELLLVSTGGLIVNLLGLKFIGHAHHGHGHDHGHDHSHAHVAPPANSHTRSHAHKNSDSHDHDHDHDHDHKLNNCHNSHVQTSPAQPSPHDHSHGQANENLAGIYLHILADTMGSVAVIISALLISYTGWSGWDPLASCIIAILIIAASIPLVTGSAKKLLLTVPSEVEYALRSTLQEISGIRGVAGYAVPRFWLDDMDVHAEAGHEHHAQEHAAEHHHDHDRNHDDDDHEHHHNQHIQIHSHNEAHLPSPQGQKMMGVIHIIATAIADLDDVRTRVDRFLKARNMDVLVHIERQAQGNCWCGGTGEGARRGSTVPM